MSRIRRPGAGRKPSVSAAARDSAAPARRRPSRQAGVAELDFNDDAAVPPRAGDPLSEGELERTQPRLRGRQAGLTGASVEREVTADDLSPETLIDEDGADAGVNRRSAPADTTLRQVGESEVFDPPADPPTGQWPPRSRRWRRP